MALRGAYTVMNSKPTMDSVLKLSHMLHRPEAEIMEWFQCYKSQQAATFITSSLSPHAPTPGQSNANGLVFDSTGCVTHPDSTSTVYPSVGMTSVNASTDTGASGLASQGASQGNVPINVSMGLVQPDFPRDSEMDLDKARVSPASSNSHGQPFGTERVMNMAGSTLLAQPHSNVQSQHQDIRLNGGITDAIRKDMSTADDTDVRDNEALQGVQSMHGLSSLQNGQQHGQTPMQAQGLYGASYMYNGDNGMAFGGSTPPLGGLTSTGGTSGVTGVTAGLVATSGSGSSAATLAPLRYSAGGAVAALGHGYMPQSGGVWYAPPSGSTVFPK